MATTSNATATATATLPRRQSCDRCHGQKLRCIRASNSNTGACKRCLQQGAQCVYSYSLPKGRPSIHRLAEASTAPSSAPAVPSAVITPITPCPEPSLRALTSGNSAAADVHVNTTTNTSANVSEDEMMAASMDTSTSNWLWPGSLDLNDMQVDGREQDSRSILSTSNLHTSTDPQTDVGLEFLDAFPIFLGWASNGSGDGGGGLPSPTHPHEQGHGLGGEVFENDTGSSMVIDKNGPDAGIAQLSQLSTRLYLLYRSSCILAETAGSSSQSKDRNQARQSPLIDDAAFKPVAAWLVRVSSNMNLLFRSDPQNGLETTTGDTLHDAFSASHHLLGILRCLQVGVSTGNSTSLTSAIPTSTSTSTGGPHLDYWASITPQSASVETFLGHEQRRRSSSYAGASSQYSDTVVHHLVIACHTLLLKIYVAVLVALQHDADLRSFSLLTGNADAGSDIRLVLVVQLCFYLIQRQYQAVDLYSSPRSGQHHDLPGSPQPSSATSTAEIRKKRNDLDIEVQQRVLRLRRTLYI